MVNGELSNEAAKRETTAGMRGAVGARDRGNLSTLRGYYWSGLVRIWARFASCRVSALGRILPDRASVLIRWSRPANALCPAACDRQVSSGPDPVRGGGSVSV